MPVWDWIRILAFNLDLDWICFICSFACNASRVALCLLPHWQRASAPRAPLWSQRWQGLGRPASLAVHHMSAFWRDNADILKWDKISQRLRNAQNGTLAYGALNSTDYFSCTIIYWFKKKHFLFLFGAILFRYRRFKYKDICEPPLKYAVCFFCVTPLWKQFLFTNLSMVHGLCTITRGSCLAIYAKSEFAPVLSRYI